MLTKLDQWAEDQGFGDWRRSSISGSIEATLRKTYSNTGVDDIVSSTALWARRPTVITGLAGAFGSVEAWPPGPPPWGAEVAQPNAMRVPTRSTAARNTVDRRRMGAPTLKEARTLKNIINRGSCSNPYTCRRKSSLAIPLCIISSFRLAAESRPAPVSPPSPTAD